MTPDELAEFCSDVLGMELRDEDCTYDETGQVNGYHRNRLLTRLMVVARDVQVEV